MIHRLDESPLTHSEQTLLHELFSRLYSDVLLAPSHAQWPKYLHRHEAPICGGVDSFVNGRNVLRFDDAWLGHAYSLAELRRACSTGKLTDAKAMATRRMIESAVDRELNCSLGCGPGGITTLIPRDVAEAIISIPFEHLAPVYDAQTRQVTCTTHARVAGVAYYDSTKFSEMCERQQKAS